MEQVFEQETRLVPYDTIYKGTSKRHRTDEKGHILRCRVLHKYLIQKQDYPTTPIPRSIVQLVFFKYRC